MSEICIYCQNDTATDVPFICEEEIAETLNSLDYAN